jgi:hypothetical protein
MRRRIFYPAISLAIVAAVFVGFAPTYYLRGYFHPQRLPLLLQLHGLVLTSWIVLLFTQTLLIAGGRTAVHRRLGLLGAVVASLVVVLGLTAAIVSARRDVAAGNAAALTFLAIPFGDMLVFAVLVAAGFYYRRRSDIHKRLMLLATTALLGAAFARWPLAMVANGPRAFFAATDVFIVAALVHDLVSRGRLHPASIWGGLLVVVSQPLRLAIAGTGAWMAVARALTTQ